uniref:Cry49Aa protein n=2 Tax=Lysinibacillus sphaericus TaxID=1421 RepID=A7WKY9_LYSSH|nr:Cry49Aa protein [Lysinibacillus sphaericus]
MENQIKEEFNKNNHGIPSDCSCIKEGDDYNSLTEVPSEINAKEFSYCSPNMFNLNLPEQSTRFQTIGSIHSNNCSFEILNNDPGYIYGDSVAGECRIAVAHRELGNGLERTGDDRFLFIFYALDNNNFIIANRHDGFVLQFLIANGQGVIVSREYQPNIRQEFTIQSINSDTFRLHSRDTNTFATVCWAQFNSWTKIVSRVDNPGAPNADLRHRSFLDINMPQLPSLTPLQPLPRLTGLEDGGLSPAQAPRAIIGRTLIPCLFVNDPVLRLESRIKQSPYYVLEHRQYWHRLWTDIFNAGERREYREVTGINHNAQNDMNNMINITIGSDGPNRLLFGHLSTPFRQQIISNSNTLGSFANSNYSSRTESITYLNTEFHQVRFARFVKAYEYRLTRADGTLVGTPWVVLDRKEMDLRTFPHNMTLNLENVKIVNADNSYDLSVWKTPLKLKDGKIIIENHENSKPYYN